jgi:hypothetical protein
MSTIALIAQGLDGATQTYIAAGVTAAGAAVGIAAANSIYRRSRLQQERNDRAVEQLRRSLESSSREIDDTDVRAADEYSMERAQLDSLNRRVQQRFDIQTKHYADALQQNNTYFYLSLAVGMLGVVIITVAGIAAILGVVDYASVAAAAGLLTEGAAGLIFNQSHKARLAAQENLRELAASNEAAERRSMSLVYSARVEDPAKRDELNAQLALESLKAAPGKSSAELSQGQIER